jgi:hypothetical protein
LYGRGCTEAIMLAHGFGLEMLGQLVIDSLADAEARSAMAGRRRIRVTWMHITVKTHPTLTQAARPSTN